MGRSQNGDKWRAGADVNLAHTHPLVSWRWQRRRGRRRRGDGYMTSQSLRVKQGKYSNKDENTRWIDGSLTQLPPNSVKCFPSCVGFPYSILPGHVTLVWIYSHILFNSPSMQDFNPLPRPVSRLIETKIQTQSTGGKEDEEKLFKLTQTTAKGNSFRNQQSLQCSSPVQNNMERRVRNCF